MIGALPRRRLRVALGCVLVIAAAVAAGVRPSAQNAVPASPRPATPTDFYYFGNERIPLVRSANEAVVEFVPGSANEQRRAIQSLLPSADVSREIQTEGRAFQLVTLPSDGVAALGAPQAQAESLSDRLRSLNNVRFAAPVYLNPATGKRMLPTNEIIVKLRPGGSREELNERAASLGLQVVEPMWRTEDEFVLRLLDAAGDPLAGARALHESGAVQWAEPNFIQEYQKSEVPNDPRFSNQWHLRNTGQGGGYPGADAGLTSAWDLEPGKWDIVIAVIDDGVDLGHEDFSPSMFINAGDGVNGIDDDGNGLVDDFSGWDFVGNDNDAFPSSAEDNHGTAVAGVAAARGNNNIGVSGACRHCQIVSIKVVTGSGFASSSALGNAIRYASTIADVINNSWGGGAPSSAIQSAIQFATTTGRGGKGSSCSLRLGTAQAAMSLSRRA